MRASESELIVGRGRGKRVISVVWMVVYLFYALV